ncbi:hypothetical protein K439DRAFT_1394149 [Ramaria rubella]|nr:hypothetical protein K439DRAFT_1394149 [Ramaria rubella]
MSEILRPSAESFRKSGWLPASKADFNKYFESLKRTILHPVYSSQNPLLPPVQAFKDFIEIDPTVYLEFIRMFEGATDSPKNYEEMLNLFNEIFRTAPAFGTLGPPLYMIMAQSMNTQGGFSAYTKQHLNFHFKEMFTTWELYLTSKDSRTVLNTSPTGWLSTAAKAAMMKEFPGRTFEEVFICDPEAKYYGYTSYEDFFNRRFAAPQIDRPTGPITDLRLISAACESTVYAYQTNVRTYDPLFIKDEKYSLIHLLANDPYVKEFVGGTILQGFLNTTGYHRWHAPVNGTIKKIVNVPGTYFAQAPSTLGEPLSHFDTNEAPPYLRSLRFFANTAARQLMFIEADNEKIGLICFIAIGMTEISTCQATVYEGEHVQRGDELGMFHFGGSSSALVFRAAANVQVDEKYQKPETPLKINEVIATGPAP